MRRSKDRRAYLDRGAIFRLIGPKFGGVRMNNRKRRWLSRLIILERVQMAMLLIIGIWVSTVGIFSCLF